MKEALKLLLKTKGFDTLVSHVENTVIIENNPIGSGFISFEFETYPSCCGIVIVKSIQYEEKKKELWKATLESFGELCIQDPTKNGHIVPEGPFGAIMIAHTDRALFKVLKEVGFTKSTGFTNPKTTRYIYVMTKVL